MAVMCNEIRELSKKENVSAHQSVCKKGADYEQP
jgi:hypothetical protein